MATDADCKDGAAKPEEPPHSWLRFVLKTVIVLITTCSLVIWLARVLWDDSAQNKYIRDLQAGSIEDRRIAASQLVISPSPEEAEKVVSALILALGDDDDEVRRLSVNSLGSVVHQLLSWWKDSPDDPRKYQPPVIAASRATIRMLKDRNDDIKAEALRALLVIHLSFLNAPPASRPVQEPILAEVPPDELRAALITALKCQNPEVRRLAAEVLERLGPLLSSDIPPELLTALEDDAEAVRERAARACHSYIEGFIPLVPDLFARLERASHPTVMPSGIVSNMVRPIRRSYLSCENGSRAPARRSGPLPPASWPI